MEKKRFRDRVVRPLLATGLALGLLACGGDDERGGTTTTIAAPSPEDSNNPAGCAANPAEWGPLPPELDPELLADALDGEPGNLRMGSVTCDEPIATESFQGKGYMTAVEGVSDDCVLLGPLTTSETPPQPGETFNSAIGVCVVAPEVEAIAV